MHSSDFWSLRLDSSSLNVYFRPCLNVCRSWLFFPISPLRTRSPPRPSRVASIASHTTSTAYRALRMRVRVRSCHLRQLAPRECRVIPSHDRSRAVTPTSRSHCSNTSIARPTRPTRNSWLRLLLLRKRRIASRRRAMKSVEMQSSWRAGQDGIVISGDLCSRIVARGGAEVG